MRGDQTQWPPITRCTMPSWAKQFMPRDLAVADAERVDDGEVARVAGGEEALLDRLVQAGGFDQAAAAADQRRRCRRR